ncbi:M24 family metallopeptidase [Oceanithermus sp.]
MDALLVTKPQNVRYLSGFTAPEDGVVFYTPERTVLFTDTRYETQAPQEAWTTVEIVNPRSGYQFLQPYFNGLRVGYESDHLPCSRKEKIEADTEARLIPTSGVVERARMVKTEAEIEKIARAARLSDEGLQHLMQFIKPGVRELGLALELEFWLRKHGAEKAAFDFIVASGPRGALPHGTASEKRLAGGELVTIDFGAVYGGYHSDMTRTLALGEPPLELRRAFDAVLQALEEALAATKAGVAARELDRVARQVIEDAGFGPRFVHSLGHGVGLEIHEAPFLNSRSEEVIEPGMVVTLEPGVYLPGTGGVRIEELVVVEENGYRLLSRSPRGWLEV